MQNVLNYIDKDINKKHPINNGNIIMSISTDSTANNDHNIGGGYRDEEVNSKSKKIENCNNNRYNRSGTNYKA